jgi:hypothetical protein
MSSRHNLSSASIASANPAIRESGHPGIVCTVPHLASDA